MFMTPLALELARLCLVSLGGEDERPWTAESTLVRGSDMVTVGWFDRVIPSDPECLAAAGWCEQAASKRQRSDGNTGSGCDGIGYL
jgi:hypothetical protein